MAKIKPLIIGAVLGAGAALLLAPQSGEKTRALVAEKANAFADEAKDFSSALPSFAQDAVKDATEMGQGVVADLQSRVKDATGTRVEEIDSDELREKIEAARRRIAAQVMENAEQSKAVNTTVAAAVEEVKADVAAVAEDAKQAVESISE